MWSKLWRRAATVYVALALAPLVVFALYYPITEGWRLIAGSDDWYMRDAVTSPERAEELAKKGLIEQLITLAEPVGLRKDETKQFDLYAIGIGQTTLPEEIDATKTFNLLSAPPPPSASGLKYASSMPVTGQFNNVVLFEPKTGALTKVFATRLAVSNSASYPDPGSKCCSSWRPIRTPTRTASSARAICMTCTCTRSRSVPCTRSPDCAATPSRS
jgi:hypothetical protein